MGQTFSSDSSKVQSGVLSSRPYASTGESDVNDEATPCSAPTPTFLSSTGTAPALAVVQNAVLRPSDSIENQQEPPLDSTPFEEKRLSSSVDPRVEQVSYSSRFFCLHPLSEERLSNHQQYSLRARISVVQGDAIIAHLKQVRRSRQNASVPIISVSGGADTGSRIMIKEVERLGWNLENCDRYRLLKIQNSSSQKVLQAFDDMYPLLAKNHGNSLEIDFLLQDCAGRYDSFWDAVEFPVIQGGTARFEMDNDSPLRSMLQVRGNKRFIKSIAHAVLIMMEDSEDRKRQREYTQQRKRKIELHESTAQASPKKRRI